MSMTQRDFIGIADALKEVHEAFEGEAKEVHEAIDRATREIGSVCFRSNPRFDRQRFYSAAGYGTGSRDVFLGEGVRALNLDAWHPKCTLCGQTVYPDSGYASGYRHAQPAMHGALVAGITVHECNARCTPDSHRSHA